MEPTFWMERWKEGRIGFHEGRPNAFLQQFGERLGEARRVLLPLCGKSEDLAWLAAHGREVLGIELVEDAVRAFFAEHGATPEEQRAGPFKQFSADLVTLWAGDFFASTAAQVGPLDAFYDRAALVALPSEMRGPYVQHLRSLLPGGARGLVITFEYPQSLMDGPPFAVPEAELRAHYQGAQVELLGEAPALSPRLREAGGRAVERCFLVTL